ncbi:glycosyl transferase [Paenalcaligenes hominis]|uniref:Glycosyl transferase n=1 Tax=Paenalcaligenes hominis TaxID=643674 RepID=A0A1U9JZL0_9BURK|nr:glycosyltransferase family 2 protein [Paenalcaligenes hominis]AQS51230.1 glycosyl transferase [Paenalcaligenes hominis]
MSIHSVRGQSAVWRYQFTVLTPTYNRAHTLHRVYESLCEQTYQDFEWVVVDDGSTDDTQELVAIWQQEAVFPIHYIWQNNQHKKVAFNRGVQAAQGELIVALDSDDRLESNALYDMARTWCDIPKAERSDYAAVIGLCKAPNGRIVGDMFPYDQIDANPLDMQFKFNIKGEKFGCLSTEVLRQFPFPENIPGFVPESLVWRRIARAGFKTRFVNQVYRVYYDSGDSLSVQGQTNAGHHALGLWLLAHDTVVSSVPWFHYRPREFFKAAARYTRFGLHMRSQAIHKPRGYDLKGLISRVLVYSMSPVGALLYLRDRFS